MGGYFFCRQFAVIFVCLLVQLRLDASSGFPGTAKTTVAAGHPRLTSWPRWQDPSPVVRSSLSRDRLCVLQAFSDLDSFDTGFSFVPVLVVVALGLGFTAQGWINRQLEGEQGLGAFLKDGKGYSRSSFRPLADGDRAASSDPLPWLSLPKLDFVEVAGQEDSGSSSDETKLMEELERLRLAMNEQLETGNLTEAAAIRNKLETRMRETGVEFMGDAYQ